MRQYEVSYLVEGSGAGMVKEVVSAASPYNASRLIEAKFRGQVVRIFSVEEVR